MAIEIVDLPINSIVIFQSYVNVCQRVMCLYWWPFYKDPWFQIDDQLQLILTCYDDMWHFSTTHGLQISKLGDVFSHVRQWSGGTGAPHCRDWTHTYLSSCTPRALCLPFHCMWFSFCTLEVKEKKLDQSPLTAMELDHSAWLGPQHWHLQCPPVPSGNLT